MMKWFVLVLLLVSFTIAGIGFGETKASNEHASVTKLDKTASLPVANAGIINKYAKTKKTGSLATKKTDTRIMPEASNSCISTLPESLSVGEYVSMRYYKSTLVEVASFAPAAKFLVEVNSVTDQLTKKNATAYVYLGLDGTTTGSLPNTFTVLDKDGTAVYKLSVQNASYNGGNSWAKASQMTCFSPPWTNETILSRGDMMGVIKLGNAAILRLVLVKANAVNLQILNKDGNIIIWNDFGKGSHEFSVDGQDYQMVVHEFDSLKNTTKITLKSI